MGNKESIFNVSFESNATIPYNNTPYTTGIDQTILVQEMFTGNHCIRKYQRNKENLWSHGPSLNDFHIEKKCDYLIQNYSPYQKRNYIKYSIATTFVLKKYSELDNFWILIH